MDRIRREIEVEKMIGGRDRDRTCDLMLANSSGGLGYREEG
jgi:hypothetical protein